MQVIRGRTHLSRRKLFAALAASPALMARFQTAQALEPGVRQGTLRLSVMPQVWGDLDLDIEERCEVLAALGFAGMDLPQPDQIPILEDYGLQPSMMVGTGTTFADGLIRRELHDQIEEATQARNRAVCAGGLPESHSIARRTAGHVQGRGRRSCRRDPVTRCAVRRGKRRVRLYGDHQFEGRRGQPHRPGVRRYRVGL